MRFFFFLSSFFNPKDSGKSEFWENQFYRSRATEVLVHLAQQLAADPLLSDWVLGLQIVNEAAMGAGERGMFAWYDETLVRSSQGPSSNGNCGGGG